MTKHELNTYLDQLYKESKEAAEKGEVPVSALLVLPDKSIILKSNQVEEKNDPFSHAEYDIIREGMERMGSRYLTDTILIVTLEPCLFCLGAILKAGIHELYYILDDEKMGSLSHYHAFVDDRLHVHRIKDERFKPIMDEFFKKLR
jgi:tRNA(adenine34) deaminase